MADTLKRELEAPSSEAEPELKKVRTEEKEEDVLAVDLAKVRRQVEYYFSDDNLKYDQFFNPKIASDPEGWLPMANILTCKRIQSLKASATDIVNALKESDLEVRQGEDGQWSVRRTTPVPPLQERLPRQERSKEHREKGRKVTDIHGAGCIIRVSDLPEEASWDTIKQALEAKLPTPPPLPPAADGKERTAHALQFVSAPNNKGSACALVAPFENDVEWFNAGNLNSIDINGATVKVELLNDVEQALEFVRSLPGPIRKKREREVMRKKKELNSKPIMVGGNKFNSIEHLRNCLREVIAEYAPGKKVNQKIAAVLTDLLKYHPNGQKKLENVSSFKVDLHAHDNANDKSKCFFVVREDGSCEDFSLQKCIAMMSQKPPFIEENTPKTAEPVKAEQQQVATDDAAQENQAPQTA